MREYQGDHITKDPDGSHLENMRILQEEDIVRWDDILHYVKHLPLCHYVKHLFKSGDDMSLGIHVLVEYDPSFYSELHNIRTRHLRQLTVA